MHESKEEEIANFKCMSRLILLWFLQLVVLVFAAVFAVLYLVRDAASRYFMVDSNFDSDYSSLDRANMAEARGGAAYSCAVCGHATAKRCARCKMVKYCSQACQISHWNSGHKMKCTELKSLYEANHTKPSSLRPRKVSLVTSPASSKIVKQSDKILFPYEEFVRARKASLVPSRGSSKIVKQSTSENWRKNYFDFPMESHRKTLGSSKINNKNFDS